MRKSILCLLLSMISLIAAAQPQLVKKWETDTLLKVPESVCFDEKNKLLYVTNIDGTDPWAEDGNGSVAKVGLDGKIINVSWVSGLNSPKGMGLYNGKLYVADLKNVLVIDVATGKVDNKIEVAGAQGLNDVSVDAKGVIYVSDMPGKKIWRIENGKQEMFVENLNRPNGVLAHNNEFFIVDNGTLFKVEKDKALTKIADGLEGGTDGIENVGGDNYIVSCWAGSIWHVKADGTKTNLLDTREQKKNAADIGYDAKNKIVYVPTFWKNSVVAYELK
jgi:YVTN family beta-propeller protein